MAMNKMVILIIGVAGGATANFILDLSLKAFQKMVSDHPWIKRLSKKQQLIFGTVIFVGISVGLYLIKPLSDKRELWERTSIKLIDAIPLPGTELMEDQLKSGIPLNLNVEVQIEPPYNWQGSGRQPILVLDWLTTRKDPNKSDWEEIKTRVIDAGGIKRMGISGVLSDKMVRNGKIVLQVKTTFDDPLKKETIAGYKSVVEIEYPIIESQK